MPALIWELSLDLVDTERSQAISADLILKNKVSQHIVVSRANWKEPLGDPRHCVNFLQGCRRHKMVRSSPSIQLTGHSDFIPSLYLLLSLTPPGLEARIK
jgi:hypothetical protein